MRPRLELSDASDEGGRTGVAPINHRDRSLRGRSVRGIADCSDGDASNYAQRHSGNDHESANEANSDLLRRDDTPQNRRRPQRVARMCPARS